MITSLKGKSISIINTTIQSAKNLASHPLDTVLATGGVVLGGVGVVGSGIGEFLSDGVATPLMIPVAGFSANSLVSSFADLTDIASGNYKQQGSFNPLKSGTELTLGTMGKGADELFNFAGYNSNLEKGGKNAGGYIFEAGDFYFGAKGVSKGVKIIANTSYRFKEVTSIRNTIIPTLLVPVNNV